MSEKVKGTRKVLDQEMNFFNVFGDSLISKYLTGVFFGDLVSVYLAIYNGVDPSPVENIDKIKEFLSE